MNPYQALGLDEGQPLTSDLVEKAHRARRGAAHPDRHGGDTSKMTELNLARDILKNPERKARYDQTGSTSTGEASRDELIATVLGNLIEHIADKAPSNATINDILTVLVTKVVEGHTTVLESQRKHPQKVKTLQKMLSAIKGPPALVSILEFRLKKIKAEEALLNHQVRTGEQMLKILKEIKLL